MSALKTQLRLILPTLSKEANANQDKDVRRHLYLIKAVCASEKSVQQVCEKRGVSTDQFYHWARRLLKSKSLECLLPISRRPKHSPRQTKKRIERKISALRRAEPSHGAERISFDLRRLFKIICAPMTVYNVLKRLKLISPEHRRKLNKRHHKRYRRPLPGYLQMDVKYVPYRINGQQFYEFNAVDHCTTWRVIRLYRNLNHYNMLTFLKVVKHLCPFPIFEVQTDNGMEFTDKYRNGLLEPSGEHPFDLWCRESNIIHRLIPIGQKELNGKVENTHKQDDREFFARGQAQTFEKLEKQMRSYNERWNAMRPTKALGWKTPNECVLLGFVRALAYLALLRETYASVAQHVTQEPQPLPRKKAKTKRTTKFARYMQWLEWDQKNSQKAILPLPVISQIFSGGQERKLSDRIEIEPF
jgi:transposase InsO family protein